MTRSERFSPVLKIAENKKRNAARLVAEANKKLQEYETKLKELSGFRSDYAMSLQVKGEVISANKLQERQKFICQLDEGINLLKKRIEGQKQTSALDKQHWLDAYKYTNSIDKLMNKLQQNELELSESRVDNELDDRSQHSKPQQ